MALALYIEKTLAIKDEPRVHHAEPGSPEEAALEKTYTTTDKDAPAGIYACLSCGKEQALERDSGHPAPCKGFRWEGVSCRATNFKLLVMVETDERLQGF